MALVHSMPARVLATDAIVGAINALAAPVLDLCFADGDFSNPFGWAVLCSMPLNETPFAASDDEDGAYAPANAVANGVADIDGGGSGPVDAFVIRESDGSLPVVWGVLGESGDEPTPDLIINNRTLTDGQIVQVTSFKYRALSA